MEVEVKMTTIHAAFALAAGYISYLISNGAISAVGKNEALAVLVGLVILYIVGQISEKLFGKEAVGGFKGWLWNGILIFFFVWIMVWTMLLNLL